MMQTLGLNYVTHINARYRRTSTLWEGRYKSCLVDSEAYVLACYRYIELNPVRAGMVERPAEYPWSSHRCNAFGEPDPLVRPHAEYLALDSASSPASRHTALFADALSEERLVEIRAYIQQQKALLGGPKFQTQIEAALGGYVRVRPAHRPRILRRLSTENGL